jgi:hypothetical protein
MEEVVGLILNREIGGIAQLVERRPCNWVVVFAGWMQHFRCGNDSIVYQNRWLTFFQKWGRGLEHAIQHCTLLWILVSCVSFASFTPSGYSFRILQGAPGIRRVGEWERKHRHKGENRVNN